MITSEKTNNVVTLTVSDDIWQRFKDKELYVRLPLFGKQNANKLILKDMNGKSTTVTVEDELKEIKTWLAENKIKKDGSMVEHTEKTIWFIRSEHLQNKLRKLYKDKLEDQDLSILDSQGEGFVQYGIDCSYDYHISYKKNQVIFTLPEVEEVEE